MKKILFLFLWCLLPLAAQTQTNPATVYLTACGIGDFVGKYTNAAPQFWHLAKTSPDVTLFFNTDQWQLYSSSYNGGAPTYLDPTGDLFGTWTNFPGADYAPTPYPVFSTNAPLDPVPLTSVILTNFWATNGSSVKFSAAGWNNADGNSNSLYVMLATNIIFVSPPIAGNGSFFSLNGTLTFDGTNLGSFILFNTGSRDYPTYSASFSISNIAPTNVSFTLGVDGNYDTNLTLSSGTIYATTAFPPFSIPPSLSLIPTSPQFPTSPFTITNATDSTFGFGAGHLVTDTNYIYVTIGTNLWKRVALTNW